MFKNNKEKEVNYISADEVEKMYEFQRKTFDAKFAEQQAKIDKLTDYISARFGEEVIDSDISSRLNEFEETIKTIENTYKKSMKNNSKELKKELEKEVQKIATELNDTQTEAYFKFIQMNEKEQEKIQKILEEEENNKEKFSSLDNLIKTHIENNELLNKELQNQLKNTNQKINKISYTGITNKFDKKIKEESSKLNKKIEEIDSIHKGKQENQEKYITQKLEEVSTHIHTNSDEILKLQELFVNENQKNNETIENNSKGISGINNKIIEITENINSSLKELELMNEKNIQEINEQKTNTENIDSAIDIINNTMGLNYEKIGQELLKLKEETKLNLEKSKNNKTDIETLKKDYNKYVTKMNNELNKLSKNIINVQKKNLETSQNLQVKIKSYIDNKIIKTDNTQKIKNLINNLDISTQEREKAQKLEIEEIINNLKLSIREREKTQRLEMEDKFNKKLKAIQKDNERILKEKIEELNSKFIKQDVSYENTNPNNVTFYKESSKNKKNIYEFIDNNQMLRKTAKSKINLEYPQEEHAQKISFFYDEED